MNTTRPILTTVTPYLNRPDMLRVWKKAIAGMLHPLVRHLLVIPLPEGQKLTDEERAMPPGIDVFTHPVPKDHVFTLGHEHNIGSQFVGTEWMMKLDVDVIPHRAFWTAILSRLLASDEETEWFNVGFLYCKRAVTQVALGIDNVPISHEAFQNLMASRVQISDTAYNYPASSQFVCRVEQYRRIGGTDERFKGYGWEDYQVLYALARDHLKRDPLPGEITFENVTKRCRDEIGRPMSRMIWEEDDRVCLLHRWHESGNTADARYKTFLNPNRQVLLDWIVKARIQSSMHNAMSR